MPTEIEAIQATLNQLQDLIEVASFYQRKMQRTDDKICNQEKRAAQITGIVERMDV